MMSFAAVKRFVEKHPNDTVIEICCGLLLEQERLDMEQDFRVSMGAAPNPISSTSFGQIGPPRTGEGFL